MQRLTYFIKFPAALHDNVAVLRTRLKQGPYRRFLVKVAQCTIQRNKCEIRPFFGKLTFNAKNYTKSFGI